MRIHFIENKDNLIMYLPDSLKFFKINSTTKSIIIDIINSQDKKYIIDKYQITEDNFNHLKKFVSDSSKEVLTYTIDEYNDYLYKLILNVTSECILNCVYCYEHNDGKNSKSYKSSNEVMQKSLDLFFNKYKNILNIQIFGGEPTLNLDTVEFIGKYINDKYTNGKMEFKPHIGMVTNGTCASDRFIDIINKYNLELTISLDGPKSINDKTRILKNGIGSSNIVLNNISKLKKFTHSIKAVESTFTQYHVDNNLSVLDIIKYLKNELQIKNVHVTPVNAKKAKDFYLQNKKSFIDSIPAIIDYKSKTGQNYSYMILDRMISDLLHKSTSKHICNAGLSTFSVSVNGDIYPCFMLDNVKQYKLGNVFDDFSLIKQVDRFKINKCKDCFNNTLCFGCLGSNYFSTGDIYNTPNEDCEFKKKLSEQLIISLANIS